MKLLICRGREQVRRATTAEKDGSLVSSSALRRVFLATAMTSVLLTSAGGALARQSISVSAPFEVTTSRAGNYLSAFVADANRDTLAAATYFREVLRKDPNNRELIERAFIASLANGNSADANAYASRLLRFDKTNGLAHLVLALNLVKEQKWDAARERLSKTGGGNQRDITAILLTAWSYAGSGQQKKALETADQVKDPRFASLRDYHAGLIADVAGNKAEAAKRLKAAYDAERTNLRIVDTYARFLARNGDREQATSVYQEFAQLLPRHPLINAALADLASGKPMERLVRNPVGGAAEVLYLLGALGSQQNDTMIAMVYLRMALSLTPDNDMAVITLADLYERVKQNERALETYELVPEKSPLRTNADIQSGLILEVMGRSEDALKQLQGIVAEQPKDVEALTALGNLQRSRKQFAEAADTYSRIIDLLQKPARGDWTLFYFRGISYERSKQWPKAEADFRKAMELQPDQPLVLNYLGYSWVDQGLNLDEAFRLLRRAVELRPTDGYIIDSLGWAHYKLGKYDESLREMERAIQLKPGDPVINDHLGDVYWKIGRKLEAQFQWNHARDLGPEPEDLEHILKKIESGIAEEPKPAAAEANGEKNGG